jgi:hypothetical protein
MEMPFSPTPALLICLLESPCPWFCFFSIIYSTAGSCHINIRSQPAKTMLQMKTAANRLTISASNPVMTAYLAFLMPTAPKYTART